MNILLDLEEDPYLPSPIFLSTLPFSFSGTTCSLFSFSNLMKFLSNTTSLKNSLREERVYLRSSRRNLVSRPLTVLFIPVPGKTDRLVPMKDIERTMVLAKTTLRPYISITLSYAEKGVVTQDEVVNRFHRAFKCKS